jgi:cob(I)alamin adenosyltransferase
MAPARKPTPKNAKYIRAAGIDCDRGRMFGIERWTVSGLFKPMMTNKPSRARMNSALRMSLKFIPLAPKNTELRRKVNKMSIATKTGDGGLTGLMYNRRVSKCHPRVEAYGTVDELNAAIGLARASSATAGQNSRLEGIQKDLVILMGELATQPEDLPRYIKDGYPVVTKDLTAKIDVIVRDIESRKISFKDWATPGGNTAAATLDVARTTCRRAERRICALQEAGQLQNAEIIIYLNRLSDALWLMAREAEQSHSSS